MPGLDDILKQQGSLADVLQTETAESTAARAKLKLDRNSAAQASLELTQNNAELVQKHSGQQLKHTEQMRNDIDYLQQLDSDPLFSIAEEFRGILDGKSGQRNAVTRLKVSKQNSALDEQNFNVHQSVLKSKQQVVGAELAVSATQTAGEEADVAAVRARITDVTKIKQQELLDQTRQLQTADFDKLTASGVFTEQQLKEESNRRDQLVDAALLRKLSLTSSEAAAANGIERARQMDLAAKPYDEINALLATASADLAKQAVDSKGNIYNTIELKDRQTQYASSLAVSAQQQVVNKTSEAAMTDAVLATARATGLPVDGTLEQNMLALSQDPDSSPEVRAAASQAAANFAAYQANPVGVEGTVALAEARKATDVALKLAQDKERERYTKEQTLAGNEFLDTGRMTTFSSASAFLTEPFTVGSSTGSYYDSFISSSISSMAAGDIKFDVAKQQLAGISSQEASLLALATATDASPENQDARNRAVKTMFDGMTNDLLVQTLAKLGNENVTALAASSKGMADFLANVHASSEQTGVNLNQVVDALRSELPQFASKALRPAGIGKTVMAALDRVFFDNQASTFYANSVNRSITMALQPIQEAEQAKIQQQIEAGEREKSRAALPEVFRRTINLGFGGRDPKADPAFEAKLRTKITF